MLTDGGDMNVIQCRRLTHLHRWELDAPAIGRGDMDYRVVHSATGLTTAV